MRELVEDILWSSLDARRRCRDPPCVTRPHIRDAEVTDPLLEAEGIWSDAQN